jgi:uncharacterized protein YkwD
MAVVRVVGRRVWWICLLAGGARGERLLDRRLARAGRAGPGATDRMHLGHRVHDAHADEQQEMVRLHNQERSAHGSGALTWDATLASCAQDWAEQRARTKDAEVHRPKNKFGENT